MLWSSSQAKLPNHFLYLLVGFTLCALPLAAVPPVIPDERDGRVLEALLLHLLRDPQFDMTRMPTNQGTIVLHIRTPANSDPFQDNDAGIGNRTQRVQKDVIQDFRRRNWAPTSNPDKYEPVAAFYTNLTFDARITIVDLRRLPSDRGSISPFLNSYPKARGCVEAFLPGYSKDGMSAMIYGFAGPSPHGAIVIASLQNAGKGWDVEWCRVFAFL